MKHDLALAGNPAVERDDRWRLHLAVMTTALLMLLALLPAFALAQPPAAPPTELGDAPDSSNHFGTVYLAYPGTPGRFPTVTISMSPFGWLSSRTVRPARRIMFSARSRMRMGVPISSTKTSPPWDRAPA